LALRGDEGQAECAWPVPLDLPAEHARPGIQLRLIEDDGYAGPSPRTARISGPDAQRRGAAHAKVHPRTGTTSG